VEVVTRLSEGPGKDVFTWFPTGYGKSICYQLLPFVFDVKLGRTNAPLIDRSVVLVIFPLVSDSTRSLPRYPNCQSIYICVPYQSDLLKVADPNGK